MPNSIPGNINSKIVNFFWVRCYVLYGNDQNMLYICQQFDPCMPTPCFKARNLDHAPVSSNACLKWSQRIHIVQTKYKLMFASKRVMIWWPTMQVQHNRPQLQSSGKDFRCVDMDTRILFLIPGFVTQKLFFYIYFIYIWSCGAFANKFLTRHRFKELQISFDEMLVRSFLGTWTCDWQTYMSLACSIYIW